VPNKRVSIKDIAKVAGVSHPTVSRALRGQGRMSDVTRERIITIAKEMGYTPSLVARGLVTQRSHLIGLMVTQFSDPFNTEVAEGIEDEALRHGYTLFLASTRGVDPEREMQVVREMQGRQVDGIIVSSSRVGSRYADLLDEIGIRIVLINNHAGGSNVHGIYHDDYHGARQVVEHLLAQGRQRIAFLGNGRAGRAQSERQRGWSDAMLSAGNLIDVIAFGSNGRMGGGAEGAQKLLALADLRWAHAPDAICCYNDAMAIGAMSILHRQGLRIPDDVAIAGFDDIEMAAYVWPPLTTFHQPRYEMGVEAMKIMRRALDETHKSEQPVNIVMHGELVVRESA
jgi:DNA-binding LacI/PurR family transcriptional regulator